MRRIRLMLDPELSYTWHLEYSLVKRPLFNNLWSPTLFEWCLYDPYALERCLVFFDVIRILHIVQTCTRPVFEIISRFKGNVIPVNNVQWSCGNVSKIDFIRGHSQNIANRGYIRKFSWYQKVIPLILMMRARKAQERIKHTINPLWWSFGSWIKTKKWTTSHQKE